MDVPNVMKQNWGIIIASLYLIGVVYVLSANALWLGDDIIYRFHIAIGNEISSVYEAFTSQIEHYKVMNGRFLAHFLVQIFIPLLGQSFFSFVNANAWIILFVFLLKLTKVSWNDNFFILLSSFLLLFSFPTKYVPSCQIGYIWMFALVFLYIYLFFSNISRKAKWHSLWLMPLSLFAGWSQEAIVVGISVALIIYVIRNIRNVTFNQWTMFLSFGLGAMLLCLGPGTLSRTGESHGSIDFLPPFVYSLIKLFFYLRITYVLIGYVLYLKLIRNISIKELYSQTSFYVNAFLTLLVFNILIGFFGNRQLFGIELMSLILLLKYLKTYSKTTGFQITMLSVFFCLNTVITIKNLSFLKHERIIYDDICSQYLSSHDGKVYYDFKASDVTFYETYPSDVFTPFVVSTIGKYMMYLSGNTYKLTVIPTCCKNLESGNYYIKNAEGAYCVVLDKSCMPDKVMQKRKLSVGSVSKAFKSREINKDGCIYEDEKCQVIQLYDKFPFICTEEFIFN